MVLLILLFLGTNITKAQAYNMVGHPVTYHITKRKKENNIKTTSRCRRLQTTDVFYFVYYLVFTGHKSLPPFNFHYNCLCISYLYIIVYI